MSHPQPPQPAKLIVGLLFRDFTLQRGILRDLSERFGPWDFLSEPRPFAYTNYYEAEMGPGLYRQTGSFEPLVDRVLLPDIKLFTNAKEALLAKGDRRRINIDPGLLSRERLVLATGKNFTHRIYLRDGIYADLTLIYQKGRYRPLPWTYPDYQDPILIHYLGVLRQRLMFQSGGRLPRAPGKVMENGRFSL